VPPFSSWGPVTIIGEKTNDLGAITALKARELSMNPLVQKDEEEKVPPSHQPFSEPPLLMIGYKQEQHERMNGNPPAFFDRD
jgi:hypothetical protein